MKVLAIGDIVGRPGREAVRRALPILKAEHGFDFCFANAENAAGGLGLDVRSAEALFAAGVDLLTLGNHAFHRKQILDLLEGESRIVRPLNGPPDWPGQGLQVLSSEPPLVVINLLGQVFMNAANDPFQVIDTALSALDRSKHKIILVDFHAEATAEKMAMGHYLTDRVTAVLGTHTHVQTADERLLGSGTAYITDIGMTGPSEGVIGMDRETSLQRFVKRLPAAFEVASGPALLSAVLIQIDARSGQARSIQRISWREDA